MYVLSWSFTISPPPPIPGDGVYGEDNEGVDGDGEPTAAVPTGPGQDHTGGPLTVSYCPNRDLVLFRFQLT